MTLGECKRKVRKLLDEYSSGGEITVDEDIENRLTDLIDMGQKDVAQAKKLYRAATLPYSDESERLYELPTDLLELVNVYRGGIYTTAYGIFGGRLTVADDRAGEVQIEYSAMPATIPVTAGDDYELEVAADAAECIPYFAAGQLLLADLITDFSPYWQIYLQKKAQLVPTVRRSFGGGGVRQVLFRRR